MTLSPETDTPATEQAAALHIPAPANGKAPLLTFERVFSTEGVHPYDEVEWEKRDIVQTNRSTGAVQFEQRGVEFPSTWAENSSTIVATKYFRGALGSPERESSLKHLIDRVVNTYTKAAVEHGYMTPAAANIFSDELKWLLLNQHFAFNSPVWFNVGTKSSQQVSACFILSVDDSMDSILNWYREEGLIFKGGSGAGLNLSKIRSSKELLSSGGTASGPISFMRGADASAGSIKSGGATRRAAKMVVLDVDHPDIVDFIETKQKEEHKIRALRDAGFDMDLGGEDIVSVQYQNANNSVSVTDEFMRAVEDGTEFGLRARSTGEIIETVDARDLFDKIAVAAWECADPGLHYNDTMNHWHTNPETSKITASNPCSEFIYLDNTSCNLASLNLLKFLDAEGTFDVERFVKAVEIVFTAMEISIAFGDFPTPEITQMTHDHRPLGIGYANLGALLMRSGLAYDSPEGRSLSAAITSLMTGVAYRRSAEMAAVVGAYAAYEKNAEAHLRVIGQHLTAAHGLADVTGGAQTDFIAENIAGVHAEANRIAGIAADEWVEAYGLGQRFGYRNGQASLLAPTGTIGFMMGCDTTGIEPDFSLVKSKKLTDGSHMTITNNQVGPALATLGYDAAAQKSIAEYVIEHGHVVGAPGLAEEHYAIFDTAASGIRSISPEGHVDMMVAVQPFLSGAISKTVNLPETATVEEIKDVYLRSWRLGLKATAVYRDNCKAYQPLNDAKKAPAAAQAESKQPVVEKVVEKVVERVVEVPRRTKLPRSRVSKTTSFKVGQADGYLVAGTYDNGDLGEIFLKFGKQGSTLAGVMDAFSIAVSIGLQYGVPLETYVSKFKDQRFEPSGLSDDLDIRMPSSIMDYIFRRLALDYLPYEARAAYGIKTTAERTAEVNGEDPAQVGKAVVVVEEAEIRQDEVVTETTAETITVPAKVDVEVHPDIQAARDAAASAPSLHLCPSCGDMMRPAGSCHCCPSCGQTSGCS